MHWFIGFIASLYQTTVPQPEDTIEVQRIKTLFMIITLCNGIVLITVLNLDKRIRELYLYVKGRP